MTLKPARKVQSKRCNRYKKMGSLNIWRKLIFIKTDFRNLKMLILMLKSNKWNGANSIRSQLESSIKKIMCQDIPILKARRKTIMLAALQPQQFRIDSFHLSFKKKNLNWYLMLVLNRSSRTLLSLLNILGKKLNQIINKSIVFELKMRICGEN